MNTCSRLSVSVRALTGILFTRSVVRVVVMALIAATMLALVSASAANKLRLSEGFVNEPYAFSFSNAVKGEGAAQWSYTGAIPAGMTLSAGGDLSGTPTASGEFRFNVSALVGVVTTFQATVILKIKPTSFDIGYLSGVGAVSSSDAPVPAVAAMPPCPAVTSNFILATSTADEETVALTEEADHQVWSAVNMNTLTIINPGALLQHTLQNNPAAPAPPVAPVLFQKGDYVIIHIVKWKTPKPDAEKTDPQKELWALYEVSAPGGAGVPPVLTAQMNPDDKENFDTRIFGSKRVAVLMLHLNTARSWDIKYKVNVNRRIPQPIQNVLELAAFVGGAGDEVDPTCETTITRNVWGGRMMVIKHTASDVIVRLNSVASNQNGEQVTQSKEYSKSYLNEGRYHWDVSVGMPVVSIKALEFSSENGVVTAKKVERQNAYGFLNLFPRAVDLNGKSFLTSPHLVLGVPISGKPLDRPVVALGTGLYTDMLKVNFFVGVAFNKVRSPRTLVTGEPATTGQLESDLETRREKKFVLGINFPVRQFINAVKGNK